MIRGVFVKIPTPEIFWNLQNYFPKGKSIEQAHGPWTGSKMCGPQVYGTFIKCGPLKLRWRDEIRRVKDYAQDQSKPSDL
jgi:hypothetical protein